MGKMAIQSRVRGDAHTVTVDNAECRPYEFGQIVDELSMKIRNIEPHSKSSDIDASQFFCIVYALMRMGMTDREFSSILDSENPYVKAAGVFILRLTLPGKDVYRALRPFLLITDLEFSPSHNTDWRMCFGEFVEELLNSDMFFDAVLPRIPIPDRRHFQAQFATSLEIWRRRAHKFYNEQFMNTLCVGTRISGFSQLQDWLDGEVDFYRKGGLQRSRVTCLLADGTQEVFLLCDIVLWTPGGAKAKLALLNKALGINGEREEAVNVDRSHLFNKDDGTAIEDPAAASSLKRRREDIDYEEEGIIGGRRVRKELQIPRNIDWTKVKELPDLEARKDGMVEAYLREKEDGPRSMPRHAKVARTGRADRTGVVHVPEVATTFAPTHAETKASGPPLTPLEAMAKSKVEEELEWERKRQLAALMERYNATNATAKAAQRGDVDGPERMKLG
eukprot:g2751.t1